MKNREILNENDNSAKQGKKNNVVLLKSYNNSNEQQTDWGIQLSGLKQFTFIKCLFKKNSYNFMKVLLQLRID